MPDVQLLAYVWDASLMCRIEVIYLADMTCLCIPCEHLACGPVALSRSSLVELG